MNLSSSTSIFLSKTPLAAYWAATFSSIGASALHGPHHSAQKSRITRLVIDGSTTSVRNFATAFSSSIFKPMLATTIVPSVADQRLMWAIYTRCEGRGNCVVCADHRSPRRSVHFPLPLLNSAANCALPHRDRRHLARDFPKAACSATRLLSGRSSGVEHNLAKVGVGRSNRLARSITFLLQIPISGRRTIADRIVAFSRRVDRRRLSKHAGSFPETFSGIQD